MPASGRNVTSGPYLRMFALLAVVNLHAIGAARADDGSAGGANTETAAATTENTPMKMHEVMPGEMKKDGMMKEEVMKGEMEKDKHMDEILKSEESTIEGTTTEQPNDK